MKEAIVQPDLTVEIVDSPIPVPKDDEVVTKVVVSGSNPKDWKYPVWTKTPMNSGDDIAGLVISRACTLPLSGVSRMQGHVFVLSSLRKQVPAHSATLSGVMLTRYY